jgi:5-methyltetrahydrofolate--homocysteine methyltransferase
MTNPADRRNSLLDALATRILVLDGAMGTMLQAAHPTAADFGGPELEGCNENLNLTRPDLIHNIHRAYFEAGSDIVETNSFGSTPVVLAEYGLEDKAYEISKASAEIARRAALECSTTARPRFVAGSIGPTTKSITVTGGITFSELIENFRVQVHGLLDGGADLMLVETCQDTRNIKAALIAIEKVSREYGFPVPVIVSGTIEASGTMLGGQTADALYASLAHADLLAIGLNCATGPEFMTDHIRTLHEMSRTRISCYPNAGLPNEEGKYLETPASLAAQLERFVGHGWLNLIGGCCGTTPAHIAAIAQMVEGKTPPPPPKPAPPDLLFRHRDRRSRRLQPPPHRRRTHQRHRLARLQKPGQRRKMGGGDRHRQTPGPQRRAHYRCLPPAIRTRRAERHRAFLRKAHPQDQGPGDDRHHRPARHRTRAPVLPGQVDHQLHQP